MVALELAYPTGLERASRVAMARRHRTCHSATVLLVVAAVMFGACSAGDDQNEHHVTDGVFVGVDGVATDVSDTSRIVSLTGDITEVVFELGLGDRIVAVDVTTTYPPEAVELRSDGGSVGFGRALSAEAVLKHEPTLVIGDETNEPSEVFEQLRSAGVPVVILPYQTTFDGVEVKILQISEILGVPEAGNELAQRVASDISDAQDRAAQAETQPRVAYLYVRGPTVLLILGEGMQTQAMIEGAGAVDVGSQMGEGAIPLTPEALIAGAPDVIVVPEDGFDALGGIDALLEIPGIADTPAGHSRAILSYDEAYFLNFGPRVGMALDDFVTDLYPDLSD